MTPACCLTMMSWLIERPRPGALPARLGGEERIEHLVFHVRRDACAALHRARASGHRAALAGRRSLRAPRALYGPCACSRVAVSHDVPFCRAAAWPPPGSEVRILSSRASAPTLPVSVDPANAEDRAVSRAVHVCASLIVSRLSCRVPRSCRGRQRRCHDR